MGIKNFAVDKMKMLWELVFENYTIDRYIKERI